MDSSQLPLDQLRSKFHLEIKPSEVPEKGFGLVTIKAVPAAEDIFAKEQLLCVAYNEHFDSTCDNCFLWLGSSINAQGLIHAPGDSIPTLKRCSGCKIVKYCEKVCRYRKSKFSA